MSAAVPSRAAALFFQIGAPCWSLRDPIGAQLRLYEVKDGDAFAGIRANVGIEVDGVWIRMWRTGGVLFGLAR